ncbi:MAG TPA: ribonuclease domain-containing protein [Dyella sp.]|nr:ribonuclease domain-containing protein [Dyella sp.]
MRKLFGLLVVLVVALLAWRQPPHASLPEPGSSAPRPTVAVGADRAPGALPPEVDRALARIAAGGPFPHAQDGTVFGNYEHLLPDRPRGYYHEYTVETPGARTRGARRIITGGNPPAEYYYTDDHYRSFRRIGGPR